MGITHPFVSGKSDGADATLVRPSDWNAAHVLAGEGARVYHNADQSVPNTTNTILAFNSERYDTDAIHDNVTNNSRLTCKTAGKYLIVGFIRWVSNATGIREAIVRLGGTTPVKSIHVTALSGDATTCLCVSIISLAVNEYLELLGYQNSGVALDVEGGSEAYKTRFSMARIS